MDQQAPQQSAPAPKSSTKVYWIAGVVVVAIGIMWYVMSPKTPASTASQMQTQTPPVVQNQGTGSSAGSPANTPSTTSSSHYKDGTYTAEGDYMTHAGPEAVTVTVTLKGDMVTDSQFQATPNSPMSGRYMNTFSQNYKQYVVGKNVNDVQLSNISGSSLTPMGFNDALTKIKSQAAI
jgi:hypothetical protein